MRKTIELKKLPDDTLLDVTQEDLEAIFQKAKTDYPDLSGFSIRSNMYGGYDGDDRILESTLYGSREETDAERQAREIAEEERRKYLESEKIRYEALAAEQRARDEKKERAEYERLKQKYGDK